MPSRDNNPREMQMRFFFLQSIIVHGRRFWIYNKRDDTDSSWLPFGYIRKRTIISSVLVKFASGLDNWHGMGDQQQAAGDSSHTRNIFIVIVCLLFEVHLIAEYIPHYFVQM